jgi:hypothetical protein
MLSIPVEAINERNADLRRAAERDRRCRAAIVAHQAPAPEPPRRRARRTIRALATAAAGRVTTPR